MMLPFQPHLDMDLQITKSNAIVLNDTNACLPLTLIQSKVIISINYTLYWQLEWNSIWQVLIQGLGKMSLHEIGKYELKFDFNKSPWACYDNRRGPSLKGGGGGVPNVHSMSILRNGNITCLTQSMSLISPNVTYRI